MKLRSKIVALFLTLACAFGLAVAGNATKVEAALGVPKDAIDVATFDFGANKEGAAHSDGGTTAKTELSYTVNEYTISFTGMENVFGPGNDATGKSALKLGTSSKVAKFSFTVPEDVIYVELYVAGYKKTPSTTVKANGELFTITTISNDGEYTAVGVDTSEDKSLSFATVAKTYRCMIDKIVFYAEPAEEPEQPASPVLAVGCQTGVKEESKALRIFVKLDLTAEDLETFESVIAIKVTKEGANGELNHTIETLYSTVNPMTEDGEILTDAYYAVLTVVNIPNGNYTVEVLVDGVVTNTVTATVA